MDWYFLKLGYFLKKVTNSVGLIATPDLEIVVLVGINLGCPNVGIVLIKSNSKVKTTVFMALGFSIKLVKKTEFRNDEFSYS